MAEWIEADLSKLLPGEVDTILDTIDGLLTVVKTPLVLVQTVLKTAKTLLVSISAIFPPTAILADAIEDFKNDITQSGLYLLDMWDYPIKQLEPSAFGPTETFGTFRLDGAKFEASFRADLDSSFDDALDANRPQFSGEVAMLVLVVASGELSELGLSTGEDNTGEGFWGLSGSVGATSQGFEAKRWAGAWNTLRQAAELQPADKVATRVDRVVAAMRRFNRLEDTGPLQAPFDENTGSEFFENILPSNIVWDAHAVPLLEAVEALSIGPTYPNWKSVTLRDIYPDIVVIVDTIFDPVIDLLRVGSTIAEIFTDLIDTISAKVDELSDLIDKIDLILEEIERFLNMTGFYALYITSNQGVTGLRQKLLTTDSPFEDTGFFSGIALLAGSANVTAFKTLFSPLGE